MVKKSVNIKVSQSASVSSKKKNSKSKPVTEIPSNAVVVKVKHKKK